MKKQGSAKPVIEPRSHTAAARTKPAPARRHQASVTTVQSAPIDDDLDALQHEVHGMIEDAQPGEPERRGTNIQI